ASADNSRVETYTESRVQHYGIILRVVEEPGRPAAEGAGAVVVAEAAVDRKPAARKQRRRAASSERERDAVLEPAVGAQKIVRAEIRGGNVAVGVRRDERCRPALVRPRSQSGDARKGHARPGAAEHDLIVARGDGARAKRGRVVVGCLGALAKR